MPEEMCEDGLEHDIIECPNCNCHFCNSCGIDDSSHNHKEKKK